MSDGATYAMLADGKRVHFQHGPIDIIAEVFGDPAECARAYSQGFACFQNILGDLVTELPLLRRNVGDVSHPPGGDIARQMWQTCRAYTPEFVTPMAAVAGAVADKVLSAMVQGRKLQKAYANNGGDIALHLGTAARLSTAIVDNQDNPKMDARLELGAQSAVRGLATSGWRGRSMSMGIADAVTVLAETAAKADVAATLIANAINVRHSAIERRAAFELDDDTDLGNRMVTVAVGELPVEAIQEALDKGAALAADYQQRGLIQSAYLSLQSQRRVVENNNKQIQYRRYS